MHYSPEIHQNQLTTTKGIVKNTKLTSAWCPGPPDQLFDHYARTHDVHEKTVSKIMNIF